MQDSFGFNPVWFIVAGNVLKISTSMLYYDACPTCKKKVLEEGEGFRCNICQ